MAEKIIFATSNTGKAAALKMLAAKFGCEVDQVALDLIEPQANSVTEIAHNKAAQAVKLLGQPVVVEDSGFVIDALGGFPGAYTKYTLSTIGVDGLLRLAAPYPHAACHFVSAMCYLSPDGTQHTFIDNSAAGTLAAAAQPQPLDAWAELWRIFVPAGYAKPLSSFTTDERNVLMEHWQTGSVYGQFVRWITNQIRTNVL